MSKTISKGTLSLRFMQNAQRAKQQAAIELEQAEIKDEGEWEVPQEVKDAWGIGMSSASTSTVTHESSYLPFIFGDSLQTSKPKGRRTFNARGQEAQVEVDSVEDTVPPTDDNGPTETEPNTRPVSISGFKSPIPIKKKGTKKGGTKTAQELIREDVRKQPSSSHSSEPTIQAGFLRPSGVDAPSASYANSTRRGGVAPSLKRDRGVESADSGGSEGQKRKKGPKEMRLIN